MKKFKYIIFFLIFYTKESFSDKNIMAEYIKNEGLKELQKFTIIDFIGKEEESIVYKVKVNN